MKGDLISGVIARESASEIYTKSRPPRRRLDREPVPLLHQPAQRTGLPPRRRAFGIALMLRHADWPRRAEIPRGPAPGERLEHVDAGSYLKRAAFGTPARLGLAAAFVGLGLLERPRCGVAARLDGRTGAAAGVVAPGHGLGPFPRRRHLLSVCSRIFAKGRQPDGLRCPPRTSWNILDVAGQTHVAVAEKATWSLNRSPCRRPCGSTSTATPASS